MNPLYPKIIILLFIIPKKKNRVKSLILKKNIAIKNKNTPNFHITAIQLFLI